VLLDETVDVLLAAARDNDMAALRNELLGETFAYTAGGANDEDLLVREGGHDGVEGVVGKC